MVKVLVLSSSPAAIGVPTSRFGATGRFSPWYADTPVQQVQRPAFGSRFLMQVVGVFLYAQGELFLGEHRSLVHIGHYHRDFAVHGW